MYMAYDWVDWTFYLVQVKGNILGIQGRPLNCRHIFFSFCFLSLHLFPLVYVLFLVSAWSAHRLGIKDDYMRKGGLFGLRRWETG
jgi:hypothetical protein